MRRSTLFISVLSTLAFLSQPNANAQVSTREPDMLVPAGTLLRCTMSEPNFSSATVQVGDPLLCHLSGVTEFGRAAFPRGAYLGGHLDAVKEPGHFWGKGYLKIVFDRIGLPNADATLDAKIVAAQGQKVDRNGNIKGKGHAKRDAIEWMLPPLWPWKVLMLPARGPRPRLKGEQVITLRLMEDVVVPKLSARVTPSRDWRPPVYAPQDFSSRATIPAAHSLPTEESTPTVATAGYLVSSLPLADLLSRSTALAAQPQPLSRQTDTTRLTLLALRNDTIYPATEYWVDGDRLSYILPSGASGELALSEIDWSRTTQLNSERGLAVTLRSGRQTF